MAQALITEPKVILMDEPFSALDIHTRHLMQNELLRLWQEDRRAVVMITHDLEEAIALGDRVVVLAAGPKSRVIESFPVDLERPRNVAEIKLDPKFMTLYRDIWASCVAKWRKAMQAVNVRIIQIVLLVVLLGGWRTGVTSGAIDRFFFPAPYDIVKQVIDWVADAGFTSMSASR